MKKSVLSILLALALVLCGCAKEPAPTAASTAATEPSASAPTVPQPTEAPAPENQELTSVLTTEDTIVLLAGSDHLLAVLLQKPDQSGSLVAIDTDTGACLAESQLSDPYLDVMVFSDGIATWSWEKQTLQVWSDALEPLWSRTLDAGQTGILQSDGWFYILAPQGVTRVSLTDQAEQSIDVPPELEPLDLQLCIDNLSLLRCGTEENPYYSNYWLDWSSAELSPAEELPSELFLSRLRHYDSIRGHEAVWLHSPAFEEVYRLSGSQSWILESSPDAVLSESGGNTLTVFDLTQRSSVSRTTAGGVTNGVLCGAYVAFVELDHPGEVFLWNTALSPVQADTVAVLTPDDLYNELEGMAAEITARTGMPLFWSESGTDYNHGIGTGYTSDPVTDPLNIYLGMEQLLALVEEYPEGIFQEMCTEEFSPIEVYFCGAIHGDQYGFEPIGFTTYTDEAQIVVLDILTSYGPDSFRGTLVHEFMHVMENRIMQHGWDTGLDYLGYWQSFVPDPYLYFYNYNDYLDAENSPDDYTAASCMPTDNVLFLDAYSRTMPTEDRARMLEHLYPGQTSSYADYLQTGVLRQKAEYLCAMIRECFPSCRIEGKLPWEELVDVIPFSEYEEAVRTYEPIALG